MKEAVIFMSHNNSQDNPRRGTAPDRPERPANFVDIGGLEAKAKKASNERRRSPDWITRSITAVTVLGWLCAVISVVLLELARPAGENLFAGLLDEPAVSHWDISMLIWAYSAIMLSLVTSALGFIFNTTRLRRKSDRYNKLLITLCVVSAVLVVLFLLNYSRYL